MSRSQAAMQRSSLRSARYIPMASRIILRCRGRARIFSSMPAAEGTQHDLRLHQMNNAAGRATVVQVSGVVVAAHALEQGCRRPMVVQSLDRDITHFAAVGTDKPYGHAHPL